MSKKHLLYLTEEEVKALANLCRVSIKGFGQTEYIETLMANGGKTGFDKLMEKIREINNERPDGE